MRQLRFYLTPDEILAIEGAARQAQAAEMLRLATLAASTLKALTHQFAAAFARALDPLPAPVARSSSGDVGARATLASIMEELGASLPAELRARYAEELSAAARVAPLIDFGLAAWNFSVRALARVFQGAAWGLRAGARSLDVTARRLTPMHQAASAQNG
jgi:hypothetical protein